jgi:DNA-directed RNA polymerase subunit beta
VSLLLPQAPFVGTGIEKDIIKHSTSVIVAEWEGEIIYVWGKKSGDEQYGAVDYIIKVHYEKIGSKKNVIKEYNLQKYSMSNQKSLIHLRPKVVLWEQIKLWQVLAEGQSVVDGELSLGTNLRVAFMPWWWYNYEDAIIISDRLVKNDNLTSVHIEKFEIEVSDTKLWPEQTTPDIPNVSMAKLKNLDENGIVRIGSIVKGGDILVGKISPKSEGELSAEEKLIQAVFGEKSKNVKDSSLYLPSGSEGKVLDVVVLDSKKWDNLMAGVKNKITVFVATSRKIEVGDKLVGRHGNKWIISVILPEEDMPYTPDGMPVDVVLNPLGVVSRMNIGQVLESHMGLIAKLTGFNFAIPLFSGFGVNDVNGFFTGNLSDKDKDNLKKSGLSDDHVEHMIQTISNAKLPANGKFPMFDGRTGELFDNPVSVWYMYILKLEHMVEDKIHARSVWPYSLITQQPLSGKARDGWQRFWEMEVWALEAYGAVHTLQEMLTIKSDDITGRNKTYESIIKGKKIQMYGIPESYYYLANMFKWLCQNIIPLSKEQIEKVHAERREKIVKLWLKNLENVSEVVSDELQEDKPIGFIKPTAANADVDDIMDEIGGDEEVSDNE